MREGFCHVAREPVNDEPIVDGEGEMTPGMGETRGHSRRGGGGGDEAAAGLRKSRRHMGITCLRGLGG